MFGTRCKGWLVTSNQPALHNIPDDINWQIVIDRAFLNGRCKLNLAREVPFVAFPYRRIHPTKPTGVSMPISSWFSSSVNNTVRHTDRCGAFWFKIATNMLGCDLDRQCSSAASCNWYGTCRRQWQLLPSAEHSHGVLLSDILILNVEAGRTGSTTGI
jgi:hypothetical protein